MKMFLWVMVLLVCIGGVSAYSVGSLVDVSLLLQDDNGGGYVPVNDTSRCNLSVSFNGSYLFQNVSMAVVGIYHVYSFMPGSVGLYSVEAYCIYGGEDVFYFKAFNVTASSGGGVVQGGSGGGSGGGNYNYYGQNNLSGRSDLVLEKSSYVVDFGKDSFLRLSVRYYWNGNLSNSLKHDFVLRGQGVVLDSGSLVYDGVGVYSLSRDFKDDVVGDYVLSFDFDGVSKDVVVRVLSGGDLGFLTGWVTGVDGEISWLKTSLLLLALFVLVVIVWFIVRSSSKKVHS